MNLGKLVGTGSRGAIVGAAATIADVLTLTLLVASGLDPRAANAPALAVGVAIQFFGSKLYTFQDARRRTRDWLAQAALFTAIEAAAFALNLFAFDLAVRTTHVPIALLRLATSSIVYFAFSLPLWSLVFRAREVRS